MTVREPSGLNRSDTVYVPGPPPQPARPSSAYGLLFALAGCAFVALGAAAQYVAWSFGFHPNLGPPALALPPGSGELLRVGATAFAGCAVLLLLVSIPFQRLRWVRRFAPTVLFFCVLIGGLGLSEVQAEGIAIYSPFRFVGWGLAYGGFGEESAYFDVFTRGLLVFGGTLGAAAVALLTVRRPAGPLENTGSQGTAGWSDGDELGAEVGEGGGVVIGRRLENAKRRKASKRSGASAGDALRYAGEGHLVTVAPTRSGKGTGAVIPNLLTYPGSVVVTDPKGENYAVTAGRRARMGQAVRALDPFDQLGALSRQMEAAGRPQPEVVQATYNPMDIIDPYGEDWLESAALLAEMLVLPSGGKGEEAFWNEEAKGLLAGLILYVAAAELDEELRPTERRTLARVRELLTLPQREFKGLMDEMLRSPLCGGLVRRSAARHLQKEDRERSSVVSTAQSHTHFLDSPRMAGAMGSSSLDLKRLRREGVSLYLVLPAHHLDTYARWLRLVVACSLHELARSPGKPTVNGRPHRVLFLLDEFAHLGRMNPVLRAFGLMAGFGVQVWAFLQDLSQLKATYPDRWGTFLANADVLQAFGTNDHDTARYLSELTGEATVWAPTAGESLSRSRGKHATRSQGASQSFAERGRRLLTPDEVRRLPRDEQLLFVKGTRPIRAEKADYLTDLEFVGRRGRPLFDENPMHVARDVGERPRPAAGTLVGDGEPEPSTDPVKSVLETDEWTFDSDDIPDCLKNPPRVR